MASKKITKKSSGLEDPHTEGIPEEPSTGESLGNIVAAALEKQQQAHSAALEKQQQERREDMAELANQFQQQMAHLQAMLSSLQLAQHAGEHPPPEKPQRIDREGT